MNLLHEKQSDDPCPRDGQACWQFYNCIKFLCSAHGDTDTDCWLIPKTHCRNFIADDFLEKLATCLSCDYFRQKGDLHPQGINYFIADQLRNFNTKAFEHKFQKEESFVEILNRIPDGVFTFDKDWRINYFNPAAESITGFFAEDAVGMYCDDVFKISGTGSGNALREAVSNGVDVHNREYEIVNIDGKGKSVMCSTSAFRNSKGEVQGGVEIFKDITEFKKLQEEVVKREKKYRRIFEGGHDMIYISTPEGKILDVNDGGVEMLGFSNKEEMLALDSATAFYANPSDRGKMVALLNRDGSVKDLELKFVRTDGKPVHVLLSSRSYEDSNTGKIQYEGIIKDITKRKETAELIRKRNRELSILNSIAVAINYTMDLDSLLKVTLGRVLSVLTISQGGIFLIDRAEKKTILGATVNLPDVKKGEPVELIFKDLLLREYLIGGAQKLMPEASFPYFQACYSINNDDKLLCLSCHLIISKGKPVGFFAFVLPSGKIMDYQEVHLIGSLGNFLGNAIENVQMIETIRQNRQDLRRLTEKLFQSQEDERRRLARELHDEAGQSLTAVKLGLDNLEQKISDKDVGIKKILSDTRQMLVRTSSEIRRLAYNLHPTLLTDLGLEPALKLYFKDIETHSGLNIEFQMVGFTGRIEKDLETSLYRFSQEAMTNTLKHSGAELFKLKIIKSFPKLIFIAEDDGIGFDEKQVCEDKRSLGLLGMRERVQLLGGTFHVRGRLGQGARIRIEIKMARDYETFTKG
ncbi:MAG: PAS domain S-box protein [Desulforhopalus sp.]